MVFTFMHQFEEFVYPGGFREKVREFFNGIGVRIEGLNAWIIITNILFAFVIVLAFLLGINYPVFTNSVILGVFINGLLHIGKCVRSLEYFPGLYTSILFYVPLGSLLLFDWNILLIDKMIYIGLGLLINAFPFVFLILLFRKKVPANNTQAAKF